MKPGHNLGKTYRKTTTEEQRAFAERLKAFRRRHGLFQRELAQLLDMRQATIADLELCREQPWPRTVLRFRELEEQYEKADEREMDALEGTS